VKEKHENIPAERSAGIFFVIGQYGPEGFCQKTETGGEGCGAQRADRRNAFKVSRQ
jgi:hypothetical protein